jgi:hypothetical protein
VPGNGFFAFAIRPNIVSTTTSRKVPTAFGQLLLKVATFHVVKCTRMGVPLFQFVLLGPAWSACRAAPNSKLTVA